MRTDPVLDALQQALVDALEADTDVRAAVAPHDADWAASFEPRAMQIAAKLVKRWTRRDPKETAQTGVMKR